VGNWREYGQIFTRGFTIVFLTATNVYQVSHAHYLGAFVVGFLISAVWWSNARKSNRSELPLAGPCYALGAGAGTVVGMVLSTLFYNGL
jgi:hypothetical protein